MEEEDVTFRTRILIAAAAIPAVITSIVGLITIWGWLTAPGTKLVTEVQYSDFVWPPGFEKPELPGVGRIEGIWFLRLRNNGSLTTTAVTLTLPPDVMFARVTRPGAASEDLRFREVIAIGDLQPQQGVSIVVWTHSRPSALSADSIRASHSAGIGAVVILAPAGPFWVWMEKNWLSLVLLAAVGVLPWIALSIGQRVVAAQVARRYPKL